MMKPWPISEGYHLREYDFEAIGLLAECQFISGDTTGALGLLDKTFWRFQSLDENGFYIRGIINLWQKQYDSATVNFTAVTKFQKHHDDVLTLRGLAYFLKGDTSWQKSILSPG